MRKCPGESRTYNLASTTIFRLLRPHVHKRQLKILLSFLVFFFSVAQCTLYHPLASDSFCVELRMLCVSWKPPQVISNLSHGSPPFTLPTTPWTIVAAGCYASRMVPLIWLFCNHLRMYARKVCEGRENAVSERRA